MMLNQFDNNYQNFCKVYNVEAKIKQIANEFPDSYHVGIFGGQDKTGEIDLD